MLKFIAPLAAAVAVLAASPVLAGQDAPTTRVEYKDLDLSTKQGRATLDRRIEQAARSVCPSSAVTGSHIPRKNACVETAIKSVKQSLAAKGIGSVVASR